VETTCLAFFKNPESQASASFLPVYLKPGEIWGGYYTNFTKRVVEHWKQARQNEAVIKANPDIPYPYVPKDEEAEASLAARRDAIRKQKVLFANTLAWRAGLYEVTYEAHVQGLSKPTALTYSFMLHESEVGEILNAENLIGKTSPTHIWPEALLAEKRQG